jgi:hypothetical protein
MNRIIHPVDPNNHDISLAATLSAPQSCGSRPGESEMDLYHIWCDLKPGVKDVALVEGVRKYLGHLQSEGLIESWRLTRRKLGLGPSTIGEFHIVIETKDLAQLDRAFVSVSSRREPVEGIHFGVNALVQNAIFALYRDFPDPQRAFGEEKF